MQEMQKEVLTVVCSPAPWHFQGPTPQAALRWLNP